MARRRISEHFSIDFGNNNPAWREMRNSPGVDEYLHRVGEETVARCNEDLRAAQAQRRQPVEDGYDYTHHPRHTIPAQHFPGHAARDGARSGEPVDPEERHRRHRER
jgi:hypothetical protein